MIQDRFHFEFSYQEAFKRNLGFVSKSEQLTLGNKRIALPGLGGVGGHHLHSFLRLGMQKFNLSDFDQFELANFNRQKGATMDSLGRPKVDVLSKMAMAINPLSEIRKFPDGITEANMGEFLEGVDLVVDTLDLYAMPLKLKLFSRAHRLGIPVVTAGPLGMGTAVMAFDPDGMSFAEYFDIGDDLPLEEMIAKFLIGLAPNLYFLKSLVKQSFVNVSEKDLPSLELGCSAAAAALGPLAMRILLQRQVIPWAPRGFQVDFYSWKSRSFHYPKGNRSLVQKARYAIAKRVFGNMIKGTSWKGEPLP